MGSDFLQRAKKRINAARDCDRERLAEETLFTRHPACACYAGRARTRAGAVLQNNDEILIQKQGTTLFATRGMDIVADFESPLADMLDAVECAGGILPGKVVNVMQLINSVEIILCP
jgi:hypothetical protein